MVSFHLGMVGTCVGTAVVAFLLVTLTYIKEMFHHKPTSPNQGQAFVTGNHILEVSKRVSVRKLLPLLWQQIFISLDLDVLVVHPHSIGDLKLAADIPGLSVDVGCHELQLLPFPVSIVGKCNRILHFQSHSRNEEDPFRQTSSQVISPTVPCWRVWRSDSRPGPDVWHRG